MRELHNLEHEPLKILFVLPNLDLAGAQKVVVEVIRGLDRSRYFPIVCCLQGFGYYEDMLRQWDVQLFDIRPSGLHDLGFVWRIMKLIQHNDIRLVNTHQHLFDFWVALSSRLTRVPCIVTKHSLFEPRRGLERIVRINLERLTQRLAARYVAVSKAVCDHLVSLYGLRMEALEVVHNGMAFDQYKLDPQLRQRTRGELGVPSSQFLIGTVANLRPAKGYETLIEALPAVIKICPNVSLIWIGRDVGGFKEHLVRRAEGLRVREYIQFVGKRDDVPRILKALDLFVLPSLREGLPYSVLEAMAAGLPVIATRVGGIPEIIVHGQTGLLVEPEDELALASAVINLIGDSEKACELGGAGRREVLSRFNVQRMVDRYQEVFDACINESK